MADEQALCPAELPQAGAPRESKGESADTQHPMDSAWNQKIPDKPQIWGLPCSLLCEACPGPSKRKVCL